MTKKNRKQKNEKPAENESDKVDADLTESTPVEGEAAASSSEAEAGADESASDEVSMDDLLDDVRRSLIEDAQSEEKKPGWLKRIKKGFQKDEGIEASQAEIEAATVMPEVAPAKLQEDEYLDQIDELIEMLEPEADAMQSDIVLPADSTVITEVAPLPEPEVPMDMEELKKRAFSHREGAEEQEMSEVRAVALEGGEDVFVEIEAQREDIAQDRMKAFENSLRPYRQYIYFAVAFLSVVMAALAIGIMYTFYQRSQPPEPTPIVSNLPRPIAMTLPGGLNFNLGKGAITDGEWNPAGPEWLQGTEICRWVAIPWSKQLEAVVRTLTPKDSIELVMSNNDRLEYSVSSIQELTLAEMQALDQNSPCLLLVLAEQDADKRWVVTAKP